MPSSVIGRYENCLDKLYCTAAMNSSSPRRIAVIGGGITGLAAAHRLLELGNKQQRSVDVTLFEASDRVGGVFGTGTIGEYTIETGADSFITNKPWAVDLCCRLGLEDQLIGTSDAHRRSLILHEGQPVPTPEGFELIVPRKLRELLRAPFLSLEGKLRVAAEAFVPPRTDKSDESLASFVTRRLGQEMLDRIVQPMVGGIYTSDPAKLSMLATLPRFVEMERQHGSLLRAVWKERAEQRSDMPDFIPSGARYGLFASLKNGMSTLLDALEQRVRQQGSLRLDSPVKMLTPSKDGGFVLRTEDSDDQRFDQVVLALPMYYAAELISPWDRDLAARLDTIEYASSAIVVTGHKLADCGHPLDAFGLVIPHIEDRRILAVSFLSRKFPGRAPEGRVVLRTFVGGAMQPELLQTDDDAIVSFVREELNDLLGVAGEPDFAVVARYERGMPQYHVGHLERVAAIEAAASVHPALALAGNAFHGVGLPDAIHSGEQAAERLMATPG